MLQDQITSKSNMDWAKQNQNNPASESPISNGPVVANAKVGELSDIVKKLLQEQRDLKYKLNERDEIIADLSKDKTTNRKNTQERRTRSLKPPMNDKKVGSADNKSLAARRIREKHTQEKDRINAIEDKIENARRRKAEIAKETSFRANRISGIGSTNIKSRPSSDFDPKLYRRKHHNSDLEGIDNGRSGKSPSLFNFTNRCI
jgi:hypothetical protein